LKSSIAAITNASNSATRNPRGRQWQTAVARARDYLKRPDVAEATEAVDTKLTSEWAVGQPFLDHLAFTYIPPIKLTSLEAHLAFQLVGASNLYLQRKGKLWKDANDVLFIMTEIAPVALNPVKLPLLEQLRVLDTSHWEEYEKLRAELVVVGPVAFHTAVAQMALGIIGVHRAGKRRVRFGGPPSGVRASPVCGESARRKVSLEGARPRIRAR
jgi:hypothetical protein